MSFCFLCNVVLENYSVQNSPWGGGGGEGGLLPAQGLYHYMHYKESIPFGKFFQLNLLVYPL